MGETQRGGRGRGGRGRGRGRGRGGRGSGGRGRGRGQTKASADDAGGSANHEHHNPTQPVVADADQQEQPRRSDSQRGGRGEGKKKNKNHDRNGGENQKQKGSGNNEGGKSEKQKGQGKKPNTSNKKGHSDSKGKNKKSESNNQKDSNDSKGKNNKKSEGKDKKGDTNDNNNEKKKNNRTKSNQPKKGPAASSGPQSPSIPPNQPQLTNDINYGKGEKITVFHVAEKPSIAQAIAKGLSSGKSTQRGKILPVHDFTGPDFPKAPKASSCRHKVSSVAGHVFSVDFPTQFQSWDSVDPAELFSAPVVKKPCKGSVVKHLQDEARGANFIILWMDCDREGENINFEVLDCCMHLMQSGGGPNYNRVYRAYFSAINTSDIQKAYHSLGKPDKNQSLSVEARQELDLKVGVAFSRFQTKYFQGRYGDLDSSVLSYGPCQTPTLQFTVQRHIDIETFKPEPYWQLDLGVLKLGRMMRATWDSGRSFNKGKVEALVEKCRETGATVTVKSVVSKEKKQGRPTPLNTVSLLKACSKALGIGPHPAMQVAERLYLSGYLSYPRTESTAYPKSFDIKGTLQQQAADSRWNLHVGELLSQGHNKARGGVDMGDHPPITPCRSAGPHELSGDMARVYEFVVRHFIASVSPDAVWQSTRVDFEVEALADKGNFTVRGKQLISRGFLAVLMHKQYGDEGEDDEEDEEEKAIPEFKKGEVIPLVQQDRSSSSGKIAVVQGVPCWASLGVKEKMTTPPSYLTEAELIGKMEKHGIGTDASIPTHIQNIQNRNYAHLESGRKLVPSKLGLVLVQGYHQIDSSLVMPQVRSDIEDQCGRIAKGLADKDTVVRKAIEIFSTKFDYFIKNIEKMDLLFGASFAKLQDVGKPFTRCGITRRYLQYIPGPPQRLYNKFTETVYPLPAGGLVKEWSGRKCPVEGCSFELCTYSVGQPPRTFPLCPNCFNQPEWSLNRDDEEGKDVIDKEDEHKERQIRKVAGRQLTLECPLPDHHPLIEELTVSPDPDSDGVLIMDPHFGPKWRLVSTRDPTIIHLPKSIDKVTILNKKDEVLGCHYMKIEFKASESPLEGETKYTCCFPTDELMQGISRVYHGSERTKAVGRGGRGRGRGRGRGGRGGRGRGRGGGRR